MAEELDTFEPTPLGRPPIYPWSEWMNGSGWRIRHGEDFDVSADNMARLVRQTARRNGMRATARVIDGKIVEFRFEALEQAA